VVAAVAEERERQQRAWARFAVWKGCALAVAAVAGLVNHLVAPSAALIVIGLFLIAWGRWRLSLDESGGER
jgi:hypothetical protein